MALCSSRLLGVSRRDGAWGHATIVQTVRRGASRDLRFDPVTKAARLAAAEQTFSETLP
jgi:hypothetical protein